MSKADQHQYVKDEEWRVMICDKHIPSSSALKTQEQYVTESRGSATVHITYISSLDIDT